MLKAFHQLEHIRSFLGKPFCEGDRFAIYNVDCIDAMNSLPNNLVDLTVTSPPYNIGKEYETQLPIEQYLEWCERWITEIHRISSSQSAFWLNLGYVAISDVARAIPLPYLIWKSCPFYMMQEVVWNYGAGVATKKALSPRNEKFLWYVKDKEHYTFNLDDIRDPDVAYPNQKKNGKLRCNTIGKNPSDVWQIAKVTSGTDRASTERAPHPAQFPLDLITRIVRGFSNPEDLVLDPFMGSGTTAEACVREGRYVVGFEIRRDYCDFIEHRLNKVSNSQRLLFGT